MKEVELGCPFTWLNSPIEKREIGSATYSQWIEENPSEVNIWIIMILQLITWRSYEVKPWPFGSAEKKFIGEGL